MNVSRKLAVVTDACAGTGVEIARLCASQGFDLIIVADDALIHDTAWAMTLTGVSCIPVQCDVASAGGIASLMAAIASAEKPVAFLFANALRVVHTNIDATVRLVFAVAASMRSWGQGRILITGCAAQLMPGSLQAVYDGSKAFFESFAEAFSSELQGSGVTVSCLMPETEAEPFGRGALPHAQIARAAFDAMLNGPSPLDQRHTIALQQAPDRRRLHP